MTSKNNLSLKSERGSISRGGHILVLENDYVDDVTAADTYALLKENNRAQIVDVRTKAEWAFVGVPELSGIAKDVLLVEWQDYPAMEARSDFAETLERELIRRGADQSDPIFFICRSGARSMAAARAMAARGWRECRNVSDGFEGRLDEHRRRGTVDGWKAANLPWVQS